MKKPKHRPVGRPQFVKGEALSVKIQVRLRPDEVLAMKRMADRKGVSLSEWARKALQSAIKDTTILAGAGEE
jgi:hypothetical protein